MQPMSAKKNEADNILRLRLLQADQPPAIVPLSECRHAVGPISLMTSAMAISFLLRR